MRDAVTRRGVLRSGFLFAAGLAGAPMLNFGRCRLFAADGPVVSTRAVDLVVESTVIDMLGLLTLDWPRLWRWQSAPESFGEAEFRRLEASGIRIFHPAVETRAPDVHEGARRWLAGWNRLLSSQPCYLAPIRSMADVLEARRLGKIGVLVGFQNSDHFRTPSDVDLFHRLGQRVSQLTYDGPNRIGSGCWAERDSGLTAFGAAVIAAMNRAGMVIDISHCGERTSREAIAESREAVLVTHSNCRALVPGQPRCKSDEIIRLMAAGGGVMGITLVRGFVGGRSPSLGDVLDHFDHVVRLVGIEHVGLGSDVDLEGLDTSGRPSRAYQIRGLTPSRRVFQLTDGLLSRGYSEAAVVGILGANFARALGKIWAHLPWPEAAERAEDRDPFCPAPNPRGALAV